MRKVQTLYDIGYDKHYFIHSHLSSSINNPIDLDPEGVSTLSFFRHWVTATKTETLTIVTPVSHLCLTKYNDCGIYPLGTPQQKEVNTPCLSTLPCFLPFQPPIQHRQSLIGTATLTRRGGQRSDDSPTGPLLPLGPPLI